MKILRVGDPHIKISNLTDAQRLLSFVELVATQHLVDRIEILGDLFHNHAVVRVEVLEFWNKWLTLLSESFDTVVLVGNHDQTGNYVGGQHALSMFKHIKSDKLTIVDEPTLSGVFGYVPYVHHEEEFVRQANELAGLGAKILVCHQTYQGSMYDNGMYAPDGFNIEKLNFKLIISGHIHKRQRFGSETQKVIYPGTGKWDTASDANEDKGLWLVEHAENGDIVKEEFISTKEVCTPIYEVVWNEGEERPAIPEFGKATFELIGTSEWIKKAKEQIKGKVATRSKITDKVRPESRKSVINGLETWVRSAFEPVTGVERDELMVWMKENGLV